MYFNWKEHFSTVSIVIALIFIMQSGYIVYDAFRDYSARCELVRITSQLEDLSASLEKVQPKISQLKADRLELYKALSSCNFLRKMEKLPLNHVEMDLFKAVTTYYNSEAEVTKSLEKYKAR
jgi:hypothetical protein